MTFDAPQIISAILASSLFFAILMLLRKDQITHRDGFKWVIVACLILIYGLFPSFNDYVGALLGIGYPPIIPLLLGFAVVTIKLLVADIERAKLQISVNRLTQKVAILEYEQQKLNSSK